jgi:hypothetical protein
VDTEGADVPQQVRHQLAYKVAIVTVSVDVYTLVAYGALAAIQAMIPSQFLDQASDALTVLVQGLVVIAAACVLVLIPRYWRLTGIAGGAPDLERIFEFQLAALADLRRGLQFAWLRAGYWGR